jgi:hypothetical protein
MIRIAITENGRAIPPAELTSPEQLRAAIDQARKMIAECEARLQAANSGKPTAAPKKPQGVPYSS